MSKEVNGITTQFRYDGEDLILEMNGSDSITANYTFGPGINNPLQMHREGRNLYYVKDGLGSVTALTDSVGSIIHEYAYSVFGEIIEESGETVGNPFAHTSREWEPEVGLYYYRARFYDARIGRFLSEDPIGFRGSRYNLYLYVKNAPSQLTDPWGLYYCVYIISEHTMTCTSTDPTQQNPFFQSSNFVSGNNQDPCGDCKNNPNRINVSNHGPIPVGDYTIGPQISGGRRNLVPDPSNQMSNRFGFQTHGCSDPETCSIGCIAATTNQTRDQFNQNMSLEEGNNSLTVIP